MNIPLYFNIVRKNFTLVLFLSSSLLYSQSIKEDIDLANELLIKGEKLYKNRQYDSARVFFLKASTEFIKINDERKFVYSTLKQSSCFIQNRLIDSAYNILRPLKSIIEKEYLTDSIRAYYLSNMALCYSGHEAVEKRIAANKLALDILIKNNLKIDLSRIYLNLGGDYLKKGDFNNAIRSNYSCLKNRQNSNLNKNFLQFACYLNLSANYSRLKQDELSILFSKNALSILPGLIQNRNHEYYSFVLENIGVGYMELANYDSAEVYLLKTNEVNKNIYSPNNIKFAHWNNNMGNLELYRKNYDKATYYMKEALKIYQSQNDTLNLSYSYNNLGSLYLKKGEFDKAKYFANIAYKLRRELLSLENELTLTSMLLLGDIYKHSNQDSALILYKQALKRNLFFHETAEGQFKEYLSDYAGNNWSSLLSILNSLSGIYLNQLNNNISQINTALHYITQADSLINLKREEIVYEPDKIKLNSEASEIYKKAIEICFQLNEDDKKEKQYYQNLAFDFAEKNKAGILEEAIAGVDLDTGIIRNAKFDIGKYRAKLVETDNDSLESVYRQKLLDAYYVLRENEQKNERFVKNATVNDIQQKLNSSSVLVEYVISDSVLHSFLLTKEGFEILTIPLEQPVEEMADKFLQSIVDGEKEDFVYFGKQLYDVLIHPLQLNDNINQLVIVPEGKLGLIPFEALLINKPQHHSEDFNSMDYLIKYYTISYHYSASLWLKSLEMTREKKSVPESILACAPVTFEHGQNNYLMPENVSITKSGYQPLYETEAEVDEIVSSFSAKGLRGKALKNAYANEINLKTEAPYYKYIHLSTHGISDSVRPQLSRVLLAQPLKKDSTSILDEMPSRYKEDDGFLYAGELFFMDLKNCDLFVLSACETGVGKVSSGEGVMALHRGLMYAGAPNIIYTLWKIPEKESKNLMIDFYKELQKTNFQTSYSSILRSAKLKMIKQGKKPLFWAGMEIIGN